ncbi:hypothetical protein AGRA3207_000680 [Actinomadura graeca]|uniref:Uncharacterized protein n=1 Tax=Actinomadura graeca TaxID=2750812 RepID=A0ABX8QPH9_9ACTN|nr:hypothetical protein [Actinomadura graeca]QXJ20044.1 hypothetical protein AGRA3207_000680 [Actinomadura graeca]
MSDEELAPEGEREPRGEHEIPAAPPPGPTGDARVDAVLARLGDLPGRPVPEHVEVFEEIHQRLQELLASADEDEPGPPEPADPSRPAPPPLTQRPVHPPGRPPVQPPPSQHGGPPRPPFPGALRPRPGNPA